MTGRLSPVIGPSHGTSAEGVCAQARPAAQATGTQGAWQSRPNGILDARIAPRH